MITDINGIKLLDITKDEEVVMVGGKVCGGYSNYTDCGVEYDCDYDTEISCDECVFVVAKYIGDKRRGKRPWRVR